MLRLPPQVGGAMYHGPEKEEGPNAPEGKRMISAMELRRFELARDASYTFHHYGKAASYEEAVRWTAADVQTAINRALHREGITNVRTEDFRVAQKG